MEGLVLGKRTRRYFDIFSTICFFEIMFCLNLLMDRIEEEYKHNVLIYCIFIFQIINFYMNLLMERGERENKPKVYAFNTFFYPKITSGGQAAVKRWTRRVDVFAQDYILVPVHLGMHWCLAVCI